MPAFVRRGPIGLLPIVCLFLAGAFPARAVVLWSDLGATLVKDSGPGFDILRGAVKRDDSSTDSLYFKFHVDPLSDANTEEYFAGFQLFEGDNERLAIGNSLKAWAYSAFNTAETGPSNTNAFGDFDLHSSLPESTGVGMFKTFELPRRGVERTIVFKVNYVAGTNDEVTVWLNPDLTPGATEASQPENLTTHFTANSSFDQLRIRHGGGGQGWTFSDMAVATSFNDFVDVAGAEPGGDRSGTGWDSLPFAFRSWQREQGLPQNAIHALAQTLDGYLWVGSDDGVARFDGVRFLSFGFREGLRTGPVRKLFGDSRGALWIGSSGGLTRCQEGQFTTYTTREGLPADPITALAEDKEGRIWIGSEAGLVVWQDNRPITLEALREFKGKKITALFNDPQGVMWVGAGGAGVFEFIDGKFKSLADPSPEGLLQDTHCLLVDRSGRLWIGAGDDIVLCKEAGEWRRYRIPRNLATRPFVTTLVEERNGTVWAGSVSDGLFECGGGKLTVVNAGRGLLDNLVEALLVDREGNLWVGTDAGLNQLRHKSIAVFAQGEGLDYGPVQGLAEIAPGVIWAGKPDDGLYRWEGRSFSRLAPTGLPRGNSQINTLLTARDGTCWAGTSHGLFQFKDPKSAPENAEHSVLSESDVISLIEEKEGGIWAGTRAGEVWHCFNGKFTLQTNMSQTHAISVLLHDPEGAIWLGTEGNGLWRFRDGTSAHYGKVDGLLSDIIRALHLDSQGVLWIGTSGGGLSELQNGRITTFTTREGLPDNTISQILEDDTGRLWLGSNRGLSCLGKNELEEVAGGKLAMVYPQVYGRADGMLSEICSGGFSPAGLKTKAGRLWFPTSKGIAVADPRPQTTQAPPPVVLEEVLLDSVSIADLRVPAPKYGVPPSGGPVPGPGVAESPEAFRIPPGRHRLEFRYTGLSFNAPERIRFRYRLENLDADWMEAGTRRAAFYPYVPPGQYRFRVIACNSDGIWNETGASLAFSVRPHLWQAWWFIGLSTAGLLGGVAGGARIVEKRKHQRRLEHLEQERALERERARIAQDLHDDLGSSLTRICLLSDLAKGDKDNPGQIEFHATKIAQSAAQSVRALEEIVWALRPGSDSLPSLVEYITHFANELFEGDLARCRLDLPDTLPALSLPPEMRHNIFLVVKEALTNALKHAGAKEVRLQVKAAGNLLEILVQDNGRGFAPATDGAQTKRHGLRNMHARAESMGGTLDLHSAPGKGTTVRLAVTLDSA